MSTSTPTLYPPGGYGAPKDRRGHAGADVGLPAGTEVFSADNHISVADDIFFERFPDDLKGQGIAAFVTLESGQMPSEHLRQELRAHVSKEIDRKSVV